MREFQIVVAGLGVSVLMAGCGRPNSEEEVKDYLRQESEIALNDMGDQMAAKIEEGLQDFKPVVHFVSENGVELTSPMYRIKNTETLLDQKVFTPAETVEYSVETDSLVKVGVKTPIDFKTDTAKLKYDDAKYQTAGRITEIGEGVSGSNTNVKMFGHLVLRPVDGKVQFSVTSRMEEPMEFIVFSTAPSDQDVKSKESAEERARQWAEKKKKQQESQTPGT